MSEPIIICENLVKIYKLAQVEVLALQGLDLTVERGEVMALVGPSGSGKTSLMNVIGGLDRPTAGRVVVAGQELLKLSDRQLNHYRRHVVGFVWQQVARNLVPYLNAEQNVELPMLMAGIKPAERKAWANELLEVVGLGNRKKHKLAQLSGGEQQRVAIAVALANKPQLLLADEPTGELDSATAKTIFDIFHKLNEMYGITVVIVSHDPQISRHVSRTVAIRDGKTSTETLRQVVETEKEDEAKEEQHHFIEYTVLDPAGRLQVPEEYRELYRIGRRVILETLPDGIVIRPVPGEEVTTVQPLVDEDEPPPKKQNLVSRIRKFLPMGSKGESEQK
ncbi:ABC transporter related protein [Thermobaculum terrenum ATCC BAA-798]|uniref:ABC transporter related protein n=1 Tax=Thermobaculum terrenum (strain ATCC BAA-798 / CCMEE 7001 / YNP1) TaxID=525904 RepID=D1CE43_THET1|nr:ABC transporter ATP-binding protein [Thermobaculum terrenum]ACZ41199.1 ABC transporter related protein [Thermobaculum terrenum ATCC BAA-798]